MKPTIRVKTALVAFAVILALFTLIFPDFFFGEKIQKIKEFKWGSSATDKTEQSLESVNKDRLNEIIRNIESAKQKEKDLNARTNELAKIIKCTNIISKDFCWNTLRVLALNKSVKESLITLSESIPIKIAMRSGYFDGIDIYINYNGWLVIMENPDIERVKKFLGVK